ncbi:MAG TPA: DUF454 family protein, partial [Ilumatobacteraceae bacterium]|nr:DUF454 family protein [Ilumatobacteraceae bacterium]
TRLERWILTRPGIGPLVSDYRAGLGMPRRAKQSAVISIALACSVSAWLLRERWWASLLIVVAGAVGAWWILRRVPTRADGRQRSA